MSFRNNKKCVWKPVSADNVDIINKFHFGTTTTKERA